LTESDVTESGTDAKLQLSKRFAEQVSVKFPFCPKTDSPYGKKSIVDKSVKKTKSEVKRQKTKIKEGGEKPIKCYNCN